MKLRKGWKKLNKDFDLWAKANNYPDWNKQKKWLSTHIVYREFTKEEDLPKMWELFDELVQGLSSWETQSKVLNFVTLVLDDEIGESLEDYI